MKRETLQWTLKKGSKEIIMNDSSPTNFDNLEEMGQIPEYTLLRLKHEDRQPEQINNKY